MKNIISALNNTAVKCIIAIVLNASEFGPSIQIFGDYVGERLKVFIVFWLVLLETLMESILDGS